MLAKKNLNQSARNAPNFHKKMVRTRGALVNHPSGSVNIGSFICNIARRNQRLGGDPLPPLWIFSKINLHQSAQNWPNNHMKLVGPP